MRTRQFLHATLLAAALFATAFGSASAQCKGKSGKGCEVPETPYVAILPAVTMVGVAGLYVFQRRRASQMQLAEADTTE